jgi:hypothetical protein
VRGSSGILQGRPYLIRQLHGPGCGTPATGVRQPWYSHMSRAPRVMACSAPLTWMMTPDSGWIIPGQKSSNQIESELPLPVVHRPTRASAG